MTIKQQGGIFGRNPTFNEVTVGNDIAKLTQNGTNAYLNTEKFQIRSSDGSLIGLQYNPDDNGRMQLRYAGNTKLQTTGTGISVTGSVTVSNGGGIDFSATSGTGTSELFDDYEEGTWTPEVADAQTGGNTAAGTFTGYYTKIGRMVNLMCILDNIDTTGMTAGNTLYVRNLPYAPASLIGAQRALSNVMMLNVAFDTSAIVTAEVPDNFTYARIAECSSGGSRAFIKVSDLTSGTADINLQFNYYT